LEFLPANLASLVIAFSWAINPAAGVSVDMIALAGLSFVLLTIVSLIGAQLNSVYDYELDSTDPYKKKIIQVMDQLGRGRVKRIVLAELLVSLPFLALLLYLKWKPELLLLWLAGNFLAYAYSVPPLRLKSRSWLEFLSLISALSVLPILFVYFSLTSFLNPVFFLFLIGQTLTVYSVIIPTETRDFFVDKAMKVETLSVRLGLIRASLMAIVFISAGGIISGAAFILALSSLNQLPLAIFLVVMAAADYKVLREFRKLLTLSRAYASSGQESVKREIVELSAKNPKWITLVSQAIVLMSIVFIVAKLWP